MKSKELILIKLFEENLQLESVVANMISAASKASAPNPQDIQDIGDDVDIDLVTDSTDFDNISPEDIGLLSAVSSMPGLLGDSEIKEEYDAIMLRMNSTPTQNQIQPQSQQQQVVNLQDNSHAQSTAVRDGRVVGAVDGEDEFIRKSTSLFSNTEKVEIDYSKINSNNFMSFINKGLGIDFKKEDGSIDYQKLSETLFKQKEDNSQLGAIESKYNDITEQMKSVPSTLLEAMKAALSGKNWREVVLKTDVDYSNNFDELSMSEKNKIMSTYFPNVDVKDDSTDAYKAYLLLAKDKYNIEKEKLESEALKLSSLAESKEQKFKASVSESMELFKSKFKSEVSQEQLSLIQDIMVNKSLASLFYNQDGTFKKGSAEKIALALYGDNIIAMLTSKKASKEVSDAISNTVAQRKEVDVNKNTQVKVSRSIINNNTY